MLYEIVYFLIVKITLWTEFVAKSINIVGMKVYWGKLNFFTSSVYLSNVSYLRFICPRYLPRAVVLEEMQYKTTPDWKQKNTKSGRHENCWVKNQAYFSDFCGNMTVGGLKNSVFTNGKKTKSAVCSIPSVFVILAYIGKNVVKVVLLNNYFINRTIHCFTLSISHFIAYLFNAFLKHFCN